MTCTMVSPNGNMEPLGGLNVMSIGSVPPLTIGASNSTVAKSDSAGTVAGASGGHVMVGTGSGGGSVGVVTLTANSHIPISPRESLTVTTTRVLPIVNRDPE